MELVTLKTFLAVCEEGGVLAASRKLNTVQSNITARIQRLEEELGSELFHRKGRGLALAPAGKVLREYAEQMVALEKQTEKAVRAVGEQSGDLSIGAVESFVAIRLPMALKQVRAQHEGITLKVESHTTAQLIERVASHKLDCAFVGGPVDHPQLVSEPLFDEELVLIRSVQVPVDEDALVLFREGCAYRDRALVWQRENGRTQPHRVELGTLEGIMGCVAVGLGTTLIPRSVLEQSAYRDQLRAETLPAHVSRLPMTMIRHRDIRPLTAMETLRDAVVARAEALLSVA